MNKRTGISLITLVITIVVIVILTGAIVLSISNNNPINQAQKAVIRQDIATMIEQHDLIYITELGNANGDVSKLTDNMFVGIVPKKYQPDFISNKDGIEYNCKDEMIKDIIKEMNKEKVILACERIKPTIAYITANNITDTTAEITVTALAEAEGSTIVNYKYSTDEGITYKESSKNIIELTDLKSGEEIIVKIKVVDSIGNESEEKEVKIVTIAIVDGITIPKEFFYVGGTKSTGVVISDNSADKNKGDSYEAAKTLVGNQYVWVPIETSEEFVRKEWNSGQEITSISEPYLKGYNTEVREYNEMKEKVLENKGFYIARYEASNNGGKTESKALKVPWKNISWSQSKEMAISPKSGAGYEGKQAGEKLGYTTVQTTLIYGVEWDSALKFIESTGINMTSSKGWGNYNNISFTYQTVNDETVTKEFGASTLIPTGATARHMKQNICDMAGNMAEWTMEASAISRITRGGSYYQTKETSAAYRVSNLISYYGLATGLRIALYVK